MHTENRKNSQKKFNIQTKKELVKKRIMPLCIVVQCKMCAKQGLPILTPGFKNLPEWFKSMTPWIKMGEFLQKYKNMYSLQVPIMQMHDIRN